MRMDATAIIPAIYRGVHSSLHRNLLSFKRVQDNRLQKTQWWVVIFVCNGLRLHIQAARHERVPQLHELR